MDNYDSLLNVKVNSIIKRRCLTKMEHVKNIRYMTGICGLNNAIDTYNYLIKEMYFTKILFKNKNKKFESTVKDKLYELHIQTKYNSIHGLFGSFGLFRVKYYMRYLFPEGKCQHEYYCKVNQMMIKCPYKKKSKYYCHNHTQFNDSRTRIVYDYTTLPKDLCELVGLYYNPDM